VTAEETVELAILEDVNLVEDSVWDVTVEIVGGPFICIVIVV